MPDLHAISESPAHARWIVEHHVGTQTERSRCPICEMWWPCDLVGIAALAVQAEAEVVRLRTAAICGQPGDWCCLFCLALGPDRDAIEHDETCELTSDAVYSPPVPK